jgi:hypothetical protein
MSDGCDSPFWVPGVVYCQRSELSPKKFADKKSADVISRFWTCKADKPWAGSVGMRCPTNLTACNVTVAKDCYAYFDADESINHITLILLCCIGCVCIMACMGMGAWATHCFFMVDTKSPSLFETTTKHKRRHHVV